jgi:hypothetical protein
VSVNYGKGAKKKAVKLHSLLVRTRADFKCEKCGIERGAMRTNPKTKKVTKVAIQCAHIISRRYNATLTDERNAFSLCGSCHFGFGLDPLGFAQFTIGKHGTVEIYQALRKKVDDEYKPDWDVEIERLQEMLDVAESEAAYRLSNQVT